MLILASFWLIWIRFPLGLSEIIEIQEEMLLEELRATKEKQEMVFLILTRENCYYCPKTEEMINELVDEEPYSIEPVIFAKTNCSPESPVCLSLEVNTFPSLMLVRKGEYLKYMGTRTVKDINDFLEIGFLEGFFTKLPKEKKVYSFLGIDGDPVFYIGCFALFIFSFILSAKGCRFCLRLLISVQKKENDEKSD